MAVAPLPIAVSTTALDPFDPARHLPLFRDYGISQVEISLNCEGYLRDEVRFRELAGAIRGAGLEVNSVHVPFYSQTMGKLFSLSDPDVASRQHALDWADRCLERLLALEGRFLVVHPSAEPIADEERPARVERCREGISYLLSQLPANGVRIAVECLPRTCLGHDSQELLDILAPLPAERLGICLDVNHANLREDLLTATRRYGSRILTLHLSDNDGVDERHWLPLQGIIPWREWVPALLATGFAGPLLYETAPRERGSEQPLEARVALARIQENAGRLVAFSG